MSGNIKDNLGYFAILSSLSYLLAFAINRSPAFSLTVIRENVAAVEGYWFVEEWFEITYSGTLFPLGIFLKLLYCMAALIGTSSLVLFFAGIGRRIYDTEDKKILVPTLSAIVGGVAFIISVLGVFAFTIDNATQLQEPIPFAIAFAIGGVADIVIPPLATLLVFGGVLVTIFGVGMISYQNPNDIFSKPIRLLGIIVGILGAFWFSNLPILDLNALSNLRLFLVPSQYIFGLSFLLLIEWLFLAGLTLIGNEGSNSMRGSLFLATGILVLTSALIGLAVPLSSPKADLFQFLLDWNSAANVKTLHLLLSTISAFMVLLALASLYCQSRDIWSRREKLQIFLVHLGSLVAVKALSDLSFIKYAAMDFPEAPPAALPGISASARVAIANGMIPLVVGGVLTLILGIGIISFRVFANSKLRIQRFIGLILTVLGIGYFGLLFEEPIFSVTLMIVNISGVVLSLWMFAAGVLFWRKGSF
ncbi:MAG: hypothetical protein ACFFEX_17165 [Candidatus Thorarchaeota archaeon]